MATLLSQMRVDIEPLEETAEWFRNHPNQEQGWEEAAIHYLTTYDDRWKEWMPRENFGKVFVALQEITRDRIEQ